MTRPAQDSLRHTAWIKKPDSQRCDQIVRSIFKNDTSLDRLVFLDQLVYILSHSVEKLSLYSDLREGHAERLFLRSVFAISSLLRLTEMNEVDNGLRISTYSRER